MITQLLTTALLAVSLNGVLRPDDPKRAATDVSDYWGTYSFDMTPESGGTIYFDVGVDSPVLGPSQSQVDIGAWHSVESNSKLGVTAQFSDDGNPSYYKVELGVEFLSGASYRSDIYTLLENVTFTSGWGKNTYDSSNGVQSVFTGYISREVGHTSTFQFTLSDPRPSRSVSFLLNHCTTETAYPVSVAQGDTFTAKFTAMSGYAFKGDNVAEYFDYPQGALNPTYQVSDYVGDYGSYWRSVTITAVVWADCTLTIRPAPLDEGALQDAYDRGYSDAKTTYENTNQFAWLKSIWSGMASFFAIEILPNISLGFLAFAPLLVVAIIAIVRILKHD